MGKQHAAPFNGQITEAGLKEMIRRYVQQAHEIHETTRKMKQHYGGIEDWTPEDRAWRDSTLAELKAGCTSLGYDEEAFHRILASFLEIIRNT